MDGKPKRQRNLKRTRVAMVRMTEAEQRRLHALAELLGVSISDVVRCAVRDEAERRGVAA